MATRHNTSALLLVGRLILTAEGYVWRVTHSITGNRDLQEVARDFASPHITAIVPMADDPFTAATGKTQGYRDAYRRAHRRLEQLVAKMNRNSGFGR